MNRPGLLNQVVKLMIAVLVAAPWLIAVSSSGPQLSLPVPAGRSEPLSSQRLFADFDGDRSPDAAELSAAGQDKKIRVYLSSIQARSISFDSGRTEAGKLASGDIDHDDDQDLVWYSQLDSEAVFFSLNDGSGRFGPATRYRSSDPRPELDLNPLFDRGGDPQLSAQDPDGDGSSGLRTEESPVVETAARRELPITPHPELPRETPDVRAFYLKSVLKRGPPGCLS